MRIGLLLIAGVLVACGARTGLHEDDARMSVDAGIDATEAAVDVPIEHAPDAPPPECVVDRDCDDGIGCTRDRCDVALGRCVRSPDDVACDDRRFCNGVERCAPGVGCVAGAPRTCADTLACTRDTCDDTMGRCVFAPDDSLCPISHRCDVARGCIARALAVTSTNLFEVELPSAVLRAIGPVRPFTDVALHPDRTLYAVNNNGDLWRLDSNTGASVFEASTGQNLTALDVAPDGSLYGAGHAGLFRINPGAGTATFVAPFPAGLEASGDLAVLEGRLLATARSSPSSLDTLVEFDTAAGTSRVLGPIGYRCVWGLAAFGPTLYGFTCAGEVLLINGSNGSTRELAHSTVMFYGATAR